MTILLSKQRIFTFTFALLASSIVAGCTLRKDITPPPLHLEKLQKEVPLSDSNSPVAQPYLQQHKDIPSVTSQQTNSTQDPIIIDKNIIVFDPFAQPKGPKYVEGEDRNAIAAPFVTGVVGDVEPTSIPPQPPLGSIISQEKAKPIFPQPLKGIEPNEEMQNLSK